MVILFSKTSNWKIIELQYDLKIKKMIFNYLSSNYKKHRNILKSKNDKKFLISFGYDKKSNPFIFISSLKLKTRMIKIAFIGNCNEDIIKFKEFLKSNKLNFSETDTFNIILKFDKNIDLRKIIPLDMFYEFKSAFMFVDIRGIKHKVLIFENSFKILGIRDYEEKEAKKILTSLYKKCL